MSVFVWWVVVVLVMDGVKLDGEVEAEAEVEVVEGSIVVGVGVGCISIFGKVRWVTAVVGWMHVKMGKK